ATRPGSALRHCDRWTGRAGGSAPDHQHRRRPTRITADRAARAGGVRGLRGCPSAAVYAGLTRWGRGHPGCRRVFQGLEAVYGFSEEVALSNDLEVIRDQVRRYLDDTVKPERLKDLLDQPGAFDGELWAAAVGQGWPAVSVPEELGGLGLGWPGVCVLMEELGRASVSLPLTGTAVTLHALRPTGGPEVVEGLSAALIAGERSVCIAFGEGGDAGIAAPPAVHYADGRLHGRKAMAAFAAVADYALVNARWAAGFGLFLVPLDQNGVHR